MEEVLIGRGLEAVDIGNILQKVVGVGVNLQLERKVGEKGAGKGIQANITKRMVRRSYWHFHNLLKSIFPGESGSGSDSAPAGKMQNA